MAIVPVGFSDEQLAFLFDYGTGKNVFARYMRLLLICSMKSCRGDGTITGLEMNNKRIKVCPMNFYMRE